MSKLRAPSRNRQQRRKGLSEDSAELASTSGVSGRAKAMNGHIRRLPNVLGQAALLEWLGQAPIAFHRVYVDLTGGVNLRQSDYAGRGEALASFRMGF